MNDLPFVTQVVGGPSIATVDKYEVGDLNGKHGNLNPLQDLKTDYVDWNLPLFGNTSIVGRSVVVHKVEQGKRWSCSPIVWGYSPDEADHRSAIASFHHPDGFVQGYIRFVSISASRTHSTVLLPWNMHRLIYRC